MMVPHEVSASKNLTIFEWMKLIMFMFLLLSFLTCSPRRLEEVSQICL